MNKFFLPVNTGYFTNQIPNSKCFDFYNKRSGNEIYCSIVGNITIKNGHSPNENSGTINTNKNWSDLSKIIKFNGTKPGLQFSTTWNNYLGQVQFINNNWNIHENEIKKILKTIDIIYLFNNIKESIDLANYHGFEHIQIHAAHGYLLSLLLDPYLFAKNDIIIDNLIGIANYIRNLNLESSIRISLYCDLDTTRELNRKIVFEYLCNNSFDYIDLSEGYYNYNKHYIYPTKRKDIINRLDRSLKFANSFLNQSFIVSGKMSKDIEFQNNIHVGWARDIIANPKFLIEKTIKCRNRNICHYYSNGLEDLMCPQWDSIN